MLLIFLDTETTGLNPDRHRTIEIAYKILDTASNRFLLSYETIVRQPLEVWAAADPESLKVNGFEWEQILEGKSERVVASEIMNDFNRLELGKKGGVFLCQNPSFDRVFFTQLIPTDLQTQSGWPYHWLDLASMYWSIQLSQDPDFPQKIKESDLSKNKIAERYGLSREASPHRAMNGVNHLFECYKALFSKKVL